MSKPVKELLRKDLASRLEGVTSLAVVGFAGLGAIANNKVRTQLREKDIRLTVVKNSVARAAFESVGLETAKDLLDGPCAIAFGADSVVTVVRTLLDLGKEFQALTVKAALMEGAAFGTDQIQALSKYPTRDEAIARLVSCILSPGSKIAGAARSPAAKIAGILKTIEEKQGGSAPEAEAAA